MNLDLLWTLFIEIDHTIGFGRVEIDWVSFSQVRKMLGWLPCFACEIIVMSETDLILPYL